MYQVSIGVQSVKTECFKQNMSCKSNKAKDYMEIVIKVTQIIGMLCLIAGYSRARHGETQHCHDVDCGRHGECRSDRTSYWCFCPEDWSIGGNCSAKDDCENVLCPYGGECSDGPYRYTCLCPSNFEAEDCKSNFSDCAGVHCQNGSSCIEGVDGGVYTCSCLPGLTGPGCTTNIDECANVTCLYGQCIDGFNKYTCPCEPGYTGDDCYTDIDDCYGINCLYGSCVDGVNSHMCPCPPGFTGADCETDLYEVCVENDPCDNRSQCFFPGENDECFCESKDAAACEGCCPGGLVCTSAGNETCPVGHYCRACGRGPAMCPSGYYQNENGSSKCKPCPGGHYCWNGVGVVVISDSNVCPPGFYCPIGTGALETVQVCPIGHYCPRGSSLPAPCPDGQYIYEIRGRNKDDCYNCRSGMYCVKGSAYICPGGYHCPEGSYKATAHPCPRGFFCVPGTSDVYDNPCPMGYYSDLLGLASIAECQQCDSGFYCNDSGLTQPTGPCKAGHYCIGNATVDNPMDDSTGGICPKGHYCPERTSLPIPCLLGSYKATNGSGICDDCPAGMFCESRGLDSPSGVCNIGYYCPPGQISPAPVGNMCPVGHYCPKNASLPIACLPGSYTATDGSGICDDCPVGMFCDTRGLHLPSGVCDIGYYCPPGQINPAPAGNMCPVGHYCPRGSSNAIIPCPAGSYRNVSGGYDESSCTTCGPDEFCNYTGLSEPLGRWNSGPVQKECTCTATDNIVLIVAVIMGIIIFIQAVVIGCCIVKSMRSKKSLPSEPQLPVSESVRPTPRPRRLPSISKLDHGNDDGDYERIPAYKSFKDNSVYLDLNSDGYELPASQAADRPYNNNQDYTYAYNNPENDTERRQMAPNYGGKEGQRATEDYMIMEKSKDSIETQPAGKQHQCTDDNDVSTYM